MCSSDLTIGNNEVAESLPLGEVVNRKFSMSRKWYSTSASGTVVDYDYATSGMLPNLDRLVVIQYQTSSSSEGSTVVGGNGHVISNVYSGTEFVGLRLRFRWGLGGWAVQSADLDAINDYITNQIGAYGPDSIVSIYEVPDWRTPAEADLEAQIPLSSVPVNAIPFGDWTIKVPTDYIKPDGTSYSPKNNKLFIYPYFYLELTDNAGSHKEYRYEDFVNTYDTGGNKIVKFRVQMSFTGTPAMIAIPLNYKNIAVNYDEAFVLQSLVPCSWDCNVYEAWMAQHASTYWSGIASGFLSTLPQYAVGTIPATVRGTVGIINTIMDAMATVEDKKRVADKAMGVTNSENLQYALNLDCFYAYCKQIKYGFADLIDGFFTAYGYARQRIKSPVITGRAYFNYLKTNGAKLVGSVPQEVMDKLVQIFDAGIQFWHLSNTVDSNMCNYSSLTNSIVT